MIKSAVSPLSVCFEKRDEKLQCLFGGSAALKPQPHHVHAGKTDFTVGSFCEYSFVAYAQTKFIYAHFGTPHPGRTREQNRMGLCSLRNRNVCAVNRSGKVLICAVIFQNLHFIGTPVTVFGKKRHTRSDSSHGITHS